jgi:phenylalanine-4-hydroxylase
MAVGKKVVSAFSGPADCNSFDMITHLPNSKTIKAEKTAEREELESYYSEIRNLRENKINSNKAFEIFKIVSNKYPKDWLLSLEIAEILHLQKSEKYFNEVLSHLNNLKINRPEVSHLITNGLELFI